MLKNNVNPRDTSYDNVIMLEGSYNDYLQNMWKDTFSIAEKNLSINTLKQRLLEFVKHIPKDDLTTAAENDSKIGRAHD